MNLNLAMENLGLNSKEARAYLALLELGKATAYNVSIKSGIKKPTAYVILENLVKKKFAFKISEREKQFFLAESPAKCFEKFKEKLKLTEDALPELLAIKSEDDRKINISYYEGLEEVKGMYKKLLENIDKNAENKEILAFLGCFDDVSPKLMEYWDELARERKERDITVKGIMPNCSKNKKYLENQKRFLLNLKGISAEKNNSDVSIEIYNNFIQIISAKNLQGILVNDLFLAQKLRQIFEMNWELLSVGERIIFDSKKKEKEKETKTDEEINIKINQLTTEL